MLQTNVSQTTFITLISNLWKLFRFSVYILFAKRLEKLECYGTVLLEEIFLELEKSGIFRCFFPPQ